MSDTQALWPGFCIGIDLGIARSVAAIAGDDGEVEVLPNRNGESWTPSVVSLSGKKGGSESEEYLVGTRAILNASRDPKNTVHSIKRLIGLSFADAALQETHPPRTFEILEDKSRGDLLTVSIGSSLLTPEEITAQIIQQIKNDAELRLGGPVTHAVITVPAYFTARQSSATRQSGLLAGLCVSAILDEPTAAAISVYHGMKDPPSRVLVFDFGDQTLDISVLQRTGTTFGIVSFAGDLFLGGCDLDRGFRDLISNRILSEGGIVSVANNQLMAALKQEGEAARRALCSGVHAAYSCHLSPPRADGSVFDIDIELTQEDLSEVLLPIKRRVRELLDDYLKRQSLRPEGITDVLMVGSTSAVPGFQTLLREVFEADGIRRVQLASAPTDAVAKGAALFAKMILGIRCACGRDNNLDATVCVTCGEPLQSVTVSDLGRVSIELPQTSAPDVPTIRGANTKVFVSAKSSDYDEAKQVYDFLSSRGLDVFFSDRSLPALGNSDYRDVIDHALDESEHMVVVTSSRQNVESPWVKAEWGFFINEKRSNRKTGNLITVVSRGLKPSDLPPSLRYYEVLECSRTGFERLIRYLKSADTK